MRRLAQIASGVLTRQIARRLGGRLGLVHVCAYPKSGGTWLAELLSDALGLPFPQYAVLPILRPAVVQSHWAPQPELRRVCYLIRDGRDVMVSYLFHRLRVARDPTSPGVRSARRRNEALFGRDYDPDAVGRLLPTFVDDAFRRPRAGTSLNWCDHVRGWSTLASRPDRLVLRYEELVRSPEETLARAVEAVSGRRADPRDVERAVRRRSMHRCTGRRPGEEDRLHRIRKGVVGDWHHHFDRRSAALFDHWAGELLVELGYEPDRSWVERTPAAVGSQE